MLKLLVAGRLTKDPDLHEGKNGKKDFITITVAINIGKDDTRFVEGIAFDKNAEFIMNHMKKGYSIELVGTPDINAYITKEGKASGNIKILVDSVSFGLMAKKKEDDADANRSTNF